MHFDFLMCSERSGSNLITKLLNAHPRVCGPFPSHLFRTISSNYTGYGDLSTDANWETFIEYLLAHFPGSRYLWVVRDPRDMVLTWRTLAYGGAVRATDVWLADPGNPKELAGALPAESAYDRTQTPAETEAYAGFREGCARIRSRALSPMESAIEGPLKP